MANNEEKIVTISLLGKNNKKIKEQLATKVNIEQGADNKGKLLGIDDNGKVTVVDKPKVQRFLLKQETQLQKKMMVFMFLQ